jgi:hypothetical protein
MSSLDDGHISQHFTGGLRQTGGGHYHGLSCDNQILCG